VEERLVAKIKAAVVGLGYWGPNLARNFQVGEDYELVGLCDLDQKRVDKLAASHPAARGFTSIDVMMKEAKPEIVAVCTPVASHGALVKAALEGGAHVLCEKPLAATVAEGEEIVALAEKRGKRLFVDHTFQYTGAVRYVRDYFTQGKLGDLFYVDSVRINLGLFQPDVDVIWDLAPHDLSILNFVIGKKPVSVQATGSSHNPRGFADVAYLDVRYENGVTAHLHLSWLSPVKVRRMIFSGTKSSIIYDDLEMAEKIKIYDHGVSFDVGDIETRKQVLVNYRRGEMRAPALDNKEALGVELKEIAQVVRGGNAPVATADEGLQVVRVLEAAQKSLKQDGARIAL
jgi:predicted dehydrogenase